jgi:hypothetical protein
MIPDLFLVDGFAAPRLWFYFSFVSHGLRHGLQILRRSAAVVASSTSTGRNPYHEQVVLIHPGLALNAIA